MRIPRICLLLAAMLPPAVLAQAPQPAAAVSPAEQEDLQFEDAIRDFGFVSGAARQCLPEASRAAHDRESLKSFSGLVRLFGSDRAFYYAAAFGSGASVAPDPAKCPAHLADYKAAMKSRIVSR
jgi:hypothetical protein